MINEIRSLQEQLKASKEHRKESRRLIKDCFDGVLERGECATIYADEWNDLVKHMNKRK